MPTIKNNLVAVLVFLGIIIVIGFVVLLLILEKPIDQYVGSLTTIVALVSGLGLIGARVDKVSKNVNGNTSRLLNENDYLRQRNAALEQAAVSTETGPVVVDPEPLMSEDTVERIKRDRDSLPAHRSE